MVYQAAPRLDGDCDLLTFTAMLHGDSVQVAEGKAGAGTSNKLSPEQAIQVRRQTKTKEGSSNKLSQVVAKTKFTMLGWNNCPTSGDVSNVLRSCYDGMIGCDFTESAIRRPVDVLVSHINTIIKYNEQDPLSPLQLDHAGHMDDYLESAVRRMFREVETEALHIAKLYLLWPMGDNI